MASTTDQDESQFRLESTRRILVGRKRLPLEVMLNAMDLLYDGDPTQGIKPNIVAAAGIAKDAAPYVHPRLKDVVIAGGEEPLHLDGNLKVLTDSELDVLSTLLRKLGLNTEDAA